MACPVASPEGPDAGATLSTGAARVGRSRCWRCGEMVRADMDSIGAHSEVCIPTVKCAPAGECDSYDPLCVPILSPSGVAPASPKDSASESSPGPLQRETSSNLGYRIKKVVTFWDASKAAEEGMVYLQSVQNERYLSVADGEAQTRAHKDYGDVAEESQWVIVKTGKEGVVFIRSLMTGWLLRAGHPSDPDGVLLGRGHSTSYDEWRILKGCGKEASLQSVETGAFLASGADGVAGVTMSNCTEFEGPTLWRVATVGEKAEEDGFQLQIQRKIEELTPELDPLAVYSRIEGTIERLILLMLDPVLNGIPHLKIPPAREAAKELLETHGSVKAALAHMWVEAEKNDAEYTLQARLAFKAAEFLMLRYMPFVGCGAYLSATLWYHLRIAALVAELYGHDGFDPNVQSLLLFCILPGGQGIEAPTPAEGQESAKVPEVADALQPRVAVPLLRAAEGLAHALARQVILRSTGWKTAADVYDLSAAILSEMQVAPTYEPGECLWKKEGTPPPDGYEGATLYKAEMLFRPSMARALRPAELTVLCVGAITPLAMNIIRHTLRILHGLSVVLRLPQPLVLLLLIAIIVGVGYLGYVYQDQMYEVLEAHPDWVTGAICTFHAALPLLATFEGTTLLVKGVTHWPLAALGRPGGGAGILSFLLGTWIMLRVMQRCLAEPGSPAAKGAPTQVQRVLFYTILVLGFCDLFGAHGLQVHPLPPLGALESHHWLAGLLQGTAVESQLRLLVLLKDRQVLLRVLGATRMMGLALVLFVGGLSASVGFLVAHNEFRQFVASIAPPPRLATVVLMLRRNKSLGAIGIGACAGFLFQTPPWEIIADFTRVFSVLFGSAALFLYMETFQDNREGLLDVSGGRWLLMMPETTQKVQESAMKAWAKISVQTAEQLVERSTGLVGRAVIDSTLNWVVRFWEKPLEHAVEAVVDAAEAGSHGQGAWGMVKAAAT